MNGELKTAINEERFSRIKYDGTYPKLSIQNILDHNKLTKYDIDLVVYVGSACMINFELTQAGYTTYKIQEYFPNCKVEFLSHHNAHAAATFYTSGFEEANILTFDGAGDLELQKNNKWATTHTKFSQGKDLTLTEVTSWCVNIFPMYQGFGILYNYFCYLIFKRKMNDKVKKSIKNPGYPRDLRKILGPLKKGEYYYYNEKSDTFSIKKISIKKS